MLIIIYHHRFLADNTKHASAILCGFAIYFTKGVRGNDSATLTVQCDVQPAEGVFPLQSLTWTFYCQPVSALCCLNAAVTWCIYEWNTGRHTNSHVSHCTRVVNWKRMKKMTVHICWWLDDTWLSKPFLSYYLWYLRGPLDSSADEWSTSTVAWTEYSDWMSQIAHKHTEVWLHQHMYVQV